MLPGCHLSICQRVRCSDRIQPEAHARGRTISLMAFGVQSGHSRGVLQTKAILEIRKMHYSMIVAHELKNLDNHALIVS